MIFFWWETTSTPTHLGVKIWTWRSSVVLKGFSECWRYIWYVGYGQEILIPQKKEKTPFFPKAIQPNPTQPKPPRNPCDFIISAMTPSTVHHMLRLPKIKSLTLGLLGSPYPLRKNGQLASLWNTSIQELGPWYFWVSSKQIWDFFRKEFVDFSGGKGSWCVPKVFWNNLREKRNKTLPFWFLSLEVTSTMNKQKHTWVFRRSTWPGLFSHWFSFSGKEKNPDSSISCSAWWHHPKKL